MDCERCNMKLSAYADGVLVGREADHLREHLQGCRRCREDLAEFKSMRALLRALPTPEPEPMFWADTYRAIRQQAPTRRRLRPPVWHLQHAWTYAWGAVVATLLLAAPRPVSHTTAPSATIDAASLVSIHATAHASSPLADPGTVRFALTEAHAADPTDDQQISDSE